MATLINVNSNALGTVSPVDGTSDDVILTITVVAGGETFDLSDTGTIQFQNRNCSRSMSGISKAMATESSVSRSMRATVRS